MKITIESTSKIVELVAGAPRNRIQARVWQGETDSGVPVQVFVTRISLFSEGRLGATSSRSNE